MILKKYFGFYLLILVASPLFGNAQTPTVTASEGFVLEANLKSLPENTPVYITGFSETDTLAKGKVIGGKFILKGRVKEVDSRVINFPAVNKRIVLFMGNEKISIAGTKDDFSDVVIKGSESNHDYEEFLYHIKPLYDFVTYYQKQMQAATTQGSHDTASIMLNTAYNIYETSVDQFLARKKNSPVAALVLAYSYDVDPNKDVLILEKRYAQLEGNGLQNQFARNVKTVIEDQKVGAVGTPEIDFTQKDTLGKPVSLSQFKGKYVLVDFWASWCGPCRRENPNVVMAYNKFKDKNFTILGVSLDQEKTGWAAAINNDNLAWTEVSDLKYWGNEAAQAYHIKSIPQNFLIDPNGTIIAKNLRGEQLIQKLNEVLK